MSSLIAARTNATLAEMMAWMASLPLSGLWDSWDQLQGPKWPALFLVSASLALLSYAVVRRARWAMLCVGCLLLLYGFMSVGIMGMHV